MNDIVGRVRKRLLVPWVKMGVAGVGMLIGARILEEIFRLRSIYLIMLGLTLIGFTIYKIAVIKMDAKSLNELRKMAEECKMKGKTTEADEIDREADELTAMLNIK